MRYLRLISYNQASRFSLQQENQLSEKLDAHKNMVATAAPPTKIKLSQQKAGKHSLKRRIYFVYIYIYTDRLVLLLQFRFGSWDSLMLSCGRALLPSSLPSHLFTSYYRSECGATFGIGTIGHLVLCVCACARVLVYFWDVDSRLGWTSHEQSCNARVDLDGIYNAAWGSIDLFLYRLT